MIMGNIINPRNIANCRILVVGDVMLDSYWYGKVNRISAEAPVPIIHIQSKDKRLGGAANVALNIKKLGADVTLLTVVGCDEAAINIKKLLSDSEIETYFAEDIDMETIIKLRIIGQGQQMLRIDFEKEPDKEVMAVVVEHFHELIQNHDIVIFSDYGKGGLEHIRQMLQMAQDAGKPTFVDPKGNEWTRYCGATLITPNLSEFLQVVGPCSSEMEIENKALELIIKLKLSAMLLTRSKDGMKLIETESVVSIPSEAREVSDVTGAGDTVIATLAVMFACTSDLVESTKIANKAAGIVVGKFGTAAVSYDELFESSYDES